MIRLLKLCIIMKVDKRSAQTPKIFAVITLKFKEGVICPKHADRNDNSVDPEQTAQHCLLRPVCQKT